MFNFIGSIWNSLKGNSDGNSASRNSQSCSTKQDGWKSYPLNDTNNQFSPKKSRSIVPNNSPWKIERGYSSSSSDSSWCTINDSKMSSSTSFSSRSRSDLSLSSTVSAYSEFTLASSSSDSSYLSKLDRNSSTNERHFSSTPTYTKLYTSHSIFFDSLSSTDSDDSFHSKHNKKHSNKQWIFAFGGEFCHSKFIKYLHLLFQWNWIKSTWNVNLCVLLFIPSMFCFALL